MTENEHLENIKELLAYDIPEFTPPDDGFLEIIGLSHYENINSRIYAYFLNQQKEPEIAEKFLAALFELIQQKKADKIISIDDYVVSTEYTTNKGRIDILIEDKNNESAIIIENKIYHHLDNPLEEYFDFIKGKSENKVGILLTLHQLTPQEINKLDKNYVAITHKEWIDKIKELGLPANLPLKKYIYLNDFFQTITNLSTMETNINELAKYYFEHSKKINSAIETRNEAQRFVDTQLQILAEKLSSLTRGKTDKWRHIVKHPNETTYYAIEFESLFKGNNEITVIIELSGDVYEKKEIIQEHLEKDKENGINIYKHIKEKGLILNTSGDSKYRYCHLVSKKYQLDIRKNEIEKFAEKLEGFIKEDFEKVMIEINNFLHPKPTILTEN
ncbi:MAG: PD-(D/E)XK nuclease family protein [Vicingaceae bacterium]|nr:PD-(D/E)XK nuclease family protein [Vicingaceae bacterium]